MASTYVNDLRLNELATGDASGSWGTITNTNLELIGEAFSYGTEAITTDANTHETLIADGATDPGRSMFLRYTGTLDSPCTITISAGSSSTDFTISKLWFIENATTGGENIIITSGSGANVTIPAGDVKVIYTDGAGPGGAVVDAFASLSVVDLKVQDDLSLTSDSAVLNIGADNDLKITHDGTNGDFESAGDLTLDVAGDIILDADGGDVSFRDAGVGFLNIINSSTDAVIQSLQNDKDLIFKGVDNSNPVTALTLDMSEAGQAIFNSHIKLSDDKQVFWGDGTVSIQGDAANEELSIGVNNVSALAFSSSAAVFNDGGGNIDFRVESDGNANMLFVDAGFDGVGIGVAPMDEQDGFTTLRIAGPLSLSVDSAGAGAGVYMGNNVYRDETNDRWEYVLGDEATQLVQANGDFKFRSAVAGSANGAITWVDLAEFGITGPVFNEGSTSNLDFRIESDSNANMLFVDSGNNRIGIGKSDPARTLDIHGSMEISVNTASHETFIFTTASADDAKFLMQNASAATKVQLSANGASFFNGGSVTIEAGDLVVGTSTKANTIARLDHENSGGQAQFQINAHGSASFSMLSNFSGGTVNGVPTGGFGLITPHSAPITFSTADAARMTIEEDGNVSINGAGASLIATNSYHIRAVNTTNQVSQLNYNSNASFTQDLHSWDAIRAGSTDFNFGRWRSNVGGSPDSEFIFNGAGTATADGAWNGGGADYAEYFEWADGNPSSQDRVGVSVKLDGTKIVASTSSDDASAIIGVISANPSVVGDTAGLKWQSKYERDDYNRYIWEAYTFTEWTVPATETEEAVRHIYPTDYIPSDVTVPSDATVISKDEDGKNLMRKKLNSSFDESITYVPRSDRKEWDTVGLMGKLRMTKGQKTGTNWIKMKDISDTVEEWLVR